MIHYNESRSALIAEISGRADVTHAAIEAMLSAIEEMGCAVVDSQPKLDFVHALVEPRQEGKAAALAVITDLRRQLDEVTAERDKFMSKWQDCAFAEGELAAAQPILEAARAWRDAHGLHPDLEPLDEALALASAVDAERALGGKAVSNA